VKREVFLQKVRQQLGRVADSPVATPPRFRVEARPFSVDPDSLQQLFLDRQSQLDVAVTLACSRSDAQMAVEELLKERKWRISCALDVRWAGIAGCWTDSAAEADFGLCVAEWAIAETGSVVLVLAGTHTRGASLLPPAVGFFVAKSRLVARLGDVLHFLDADGGLPACVTMVTGPSASADIVGVRTVGVHGPSQVRVYIIENE